MTYDRRKSKLQNDNNNEEIIKLYVNGRNIVGCYMFRPFAQGRVNNTKNRKRSDDDDDDNNNNNNNNNNIVHNAITQITLNDIV